MARAMAPSDVTSAKDRLAKPLPSWRRLRAIPLAVGGLAMAFGLWTGLVRLGISLPAGATSSLAALHGAIMISGFLGTVISLERAVALGCWWAYGAPVLSSAGTLLLLAGMTPAAALAFLLASAIMLVASANLVVRQPALFTVALAIGAGCWWVGTLQWLIGYSMPAVVGWWLNFLILTIAAERLELSRMAKPVPSSRITFALVVLLLLFGSAREELAAGWAPFTAAGMLGCSAWLLRHDLACRTVRLAGQPRFAAVSILAGHVWLAAAGALLAMVPPGAMVFSYDAAVHAVALGFVLSMVFGHAQIVLPVLTGARVRYSSFAYGPLALLHASVVLRVGGDLLEWVDLRAVSAIATIFALVLYAGCLTFMSWKATCRTT